MDSEMKTMSKRSRRPATGADRLPVLGNPKPLGRDSTWVDEALDESEERFRRLSEAAVEGILIHEQGTIFDVNERMGDMFGYEISEMIGLSAGHLIAPETLSRMTDRVLSGYDKAYEAVCVRKDGSTFAAEVCGKSIRYHGRTARVAAIRDITERKQAEDALRESEERYRNLFEDSRDAIYVTNQDGILIDFNESFLRLLGYTRQELAGMRVVDAYCHPVDRHKILGEMEKVGFVKDYELKLRRSDGTEMYTLLTSTVRRDANGGVLGYQGIVRDITERKRVDELLRESERRYRLLVDNVTDGIWTTDMNLRLTYVSPSVKRLLALTAKETVGQKVDRILTPASLEMAKHAITRELATEKTELKDSSQLRALELELTRKDDSTVWTDVKFGVLRDENCAPVGVLWLAHDITRHKQREQYIQLCTAAQEEERKRIARELHDETVQSLAAMLLDIEALLRMRRGLSDETVGGLKQIRNSVSHITEEVTRLIHALRPSILDYLGLVPAVELIAADLTRIGIDTYVEIVGEEQRLSTDSELGVFRIVQEAANNVKKHSHARTVTITLAFGGEGIRVSVADDGVGFRLPGRLGDFAASGNKGLMGMQERAQLMNGSLSIQSELGRGTVVTIEVCHEAYSSP